MRKKGKFKLFYLHSTLERLSDTFMSNGEREFVPRDQVSLYLSFPVHYFYTKISSFKQFFIHKNCFELFYPLFFYFILRNSQLESAVCRNNITWSLNSLFRITFTANMNLCTMWPRFPLLVSYFYKLKNSCITLFLSVRIVLDCFYLLIFYFENFINLNLTFAESGL